MLKFLFLFLFSFNLFAQSTQSVDYGFYWFKSGNSSVKASMTGDTISGFYDPKKPTVIYFHGWEQGSSVNNYQREVLVYIDPTKKNQAVDMTTKWIADGWNVGIFYWNQFSDEDEVKDAEAKIWSATGPRGMRYRLKDGSYATTMSPKESIGDVAYNDFVKIMSQYTGSEIRFAGHSLGSQVATRLAKKISDANNTTLMPKRLELLDPFWSKSSKTFLGNKVDGTMTSTCEKAGGSNPDWIGEVARCHIAKMISKNDLAVTWYKTSAIFDFGVGDGNSDLKPIVVFQNPGSDWLWFTTQQAEKHMWAKNLYFLSKSASHKTGIPSYANTPIDVIKTLMKSKRTFTQQDGRSSTDANDHGYSY